MNENDHSTDKTTCDSRALSAAPSMTENEHDSTTGGTTRMKNGPSEYEKIRNANIEANKKLLASLGLGGGVVGILGESSKKKRKNQK